MASFFQRDASSVLITGIALSTAVLVLAQVVFFSRDQTPATGALTKPLDLTPEPASPIQFGEQTTVQLSEHRYVFGPGKQAAKSDPLAGDEPLILGVGGTLLNRSNWQLNTEVGVGKMLDQQAFTLGDTVTRFSSQLSQQVSSKLALQADYRVLDGQRVRTEDWVLGLQYQINERAQWQFRHSESQDQTGLDPNQRETSMAYYLRF